MRKTCPSTPQLQRWSFHKAANTEDHYLLTNPKFQRPYHLSESGRGFRSSLRIRGHTSAYPRLQGKPSLSSKPSMTHRLFLQPEDSFRRSCRTTGNPATCIPSPSRQGRSTRRRPCRTSKGHFQRPPRNRHPHRRRRCRTAADLCPCQRQAPLRPRAHLRRYRLRLGR